MKKAPKKFIVTKKEEGRSVSSFAKVASKVGSADKQKSPSISRSFTEEKNQGLQKAARKIPEITPGSWVCLATIRTHADVLLISFICGVLLMGTAVVGIELQKNLKELARRESLHQALSSQQTYWKEVVTKYPDYKDAYFQLAVVSYQLGETSEAKHAIGKVLEIDPNDATGQEFAKKIRG